MAARPDGHYRLRAQQLPSPADVAMSSSSQRDRNVLVGDSEERACLRRLVSKPSAKSVPSLATVLRFLLWQRVSGTTASIPLDLGA